MKKKLKIQTIGTGHCYYSDYYWLLIDSLQNNNQGCGIRKITRSPKVPNHEILGAQHLNLYEKSEFFQLPKGILS